MKNYLRNKALMNKIFKINFYFSGEFFKQFWLNFLEYGSFNKSISLKNYFLILLFKINK